MRYVYGSSYQPWQKPLTLLNCILITCKNTTFYVMLIYSLLLCSLNFLTLLFYVLWSFLLYVFKNKYIYTLVAIKINTSVHIFIKNLFLLIIHSKIISNSIHTYVSILGLWYWKRDILIINSIWLLIFSICVFTWNLLKYKWRR